MVIDMQAKAAKRDARMQAKKEAIAGQQAAAAEQEDDGMAAPGQNERLEEANNAAMEKQAKQAEAAQPDPVTTKTQVKSGDR